ncbi:hypothetical protein [Gordonia sp. N1V]|uniref:hypothetical protein n=1 Tax=Gordonia sp. N1V TaxID=3034163 RepID=UPI0023E2AF0E|nr:hypothetical protein [Gordonia sp. N1V]MDF3285031.1 hypothetical protein [Gordonia sp. N1V]
MTSTHNAHPGEDRQPGAPRHTRLFGPPPWVLAVRTLAGMGALGAVLLIAGWWGVGVGAVILGGTVAVTSRFRGEKPRAVITSTGEDEKGSLR